MLGHGAKGGLDVVSNEPLPRAEMVLMTDLRIGDRFIFDGHNYTVVEPPQSTWGVVELWVDELDWPLLGSETSVVHRPV